MKTLVKPLTYILGFSVFCACTTTREYPIHQVSPTEKTRDMYVHLVNGVELTLGGATVGSDNLRGIITSADSIRAGEYFGQWETWRIERGQMEPLYEVLIPRSHIGTVKMQTADKHTNVAVAAIGILVVGVVIAVAVEGKKVKEGLCPGSSCN